MDMSQSTEEFKAGQPRPDLMLKSGSTLARGLSTPITVSSPDRFNLCRAFSYYSQSRMIPKCKVRSSERITSFHENVAADHGSLDNTYCYPTDMDLDRWTAPVPVYHACGSALK